MAKITLKDVSKVYDGSLAAVQDFNLEVEDREFVVLVGPSGCGKSTVLRMIAGLEEVSEGELYIGGRLVNDIPPKDRDVAMVFQNYALYPHMTVYENMGFPLKADGVSKPEMDQRIKESAELLGITELLHRRPNQLSGGERQRVAIGRALVREPAVFLMDEPLSNLDAKLRTELRAEIIKLRRRVDTTFIYVTHDQVEAMTLGDRLVIMRDGRIQQIGAPQHVFLHPANIFVAGFIGTPQMNFFDVKLEEQRGRYSIHLGNAVIELDGEQSSRLSSSGIESRELILGI
ncbi:MAG: ATP-binding cassette domain-containing protein, partial [Oscillospiraceae bacterium]